MDMAANSNNKNTATTVLIIGGYGNSGRPLTQLLLQHTSQDVKLIVAGRNVARAEAFVKELGAGAERVASRRVDASDAPSLREAFQDGVTLVVVASGTAKFAKTVADAAVEARVDYMDIQYSIAKTQLLKNMEAEIKDAGLCFITDCGFHPGLPAAMVRHVAPSFNRLEAAHVGSVIKIDWASLEGTSPETIEEFAGEFMDYKATVYKDGKWKDDGVMAMMNPRIMDFGAPFGRAQCIPMFLAEMNDLPLLYPSLTETGFYVGGLNWAVDWFISPIVMVVLKIWNSQAARRAMGRFMEWGLRTFSSPPYGTVLKVEARGIGSDGKPLETSVILSHKDGYALTAVPVAATILQYLAAGNDSIRQPGLWLQGNVVDPGKLMMKMEEMGVEIRPPLQSVGSNE